MRRTLVRTSAPSLSGSRRMSVDGGIGGLAVTRPDAAQGLDENVNHRRRRQVELDFARIVANKAPIPDQVPTSQLDCSPIRFYGLSAGADQVAVGEGWRVVGDTGVALEGGDDGARIRALDVGSALPTTQRVKRIPAVDRPDLSGSRGTRAPALTEQYHERLATAGSSTERAPPKQRLPPRPNLVVKHKSLHTIHQLVVGEAAVGAKMMRTRGQHWPIGRQCATSSTAPSLPRHSHAAGGRAAGAGRKHVERRVAGVILIAVEEPALLLAVQRNIGVVEIQHDLARCTLMSFEEEIDQQGIDLRSVTIDLVILRRMTPRRCSKRLSVLLPANGSQLVRSTRLNLPASTANVGSLRSSS